MWLSIYIVVLVGALAFWRVTNPPRSLNRRYIASRAEGSKGMTVSTVRDMRLAMTRYDDETPLICGSSDAVMLRLVRMRQGEHDSGAPDVRLSVEGVPESRQG
ncbi:MAG: hypothetical protein GXP10_01210 [Gammaproteobacteria bacterium]|nr:hypothetical protein [Gammaproteobacteria bacterium]